MLKNNLTLDKDDVRLKWKLHQWNHHKEYNNPVITAKVFTHKMGHKLTWPSHDGEMANLIDCVIVNRILAQMMPFVYLYGKYKFQHYIIFNLILFFISDNDEPLLSGSGDVSKECSESELESWAQVLDAWKENSNVLPKQLHSLIKGGIPEALRGEIWLRLVGCFDQSELMDSYRILITKECSAEEVILRDLHRTFPAHDYFKENGGHGQDALAKIVKAYSIYDEEIGYCQGITFIAAALLLHMPEEQAFCILVKIMSEYGLRDLFKDGLEALHLRFYQLDKLLEVRTSHFSFLFLCVSVDLYLQCLGDGEFLL
ncbi:rab GTPase-activating protein 1-like [Artemia franciscana]|uniref:rab GTPase-activating protein 1-like n=1 Tax=Artemia franciscana TaxID=6661 RepID=UPI0032DAD79E